MNTFDTKILIDRIAKKFSKIEIVDALRAKVYDARNPDQKASGKIKVKENVVEERSNCRGRFDPAK